MIQAFPPPSYSASYFAGQFDNWRKPTNPNERQTAHFHKLTFGLQIAFIQAVEFTKVQMLRIQRSGKRQVVFKLSGRMDAQNTVELRAMIEAEEKCHPVILDLTDVTLVDRDAVKFLERCQTDNIKLKNCPPYIREWIKREREATNS